MLLKVFDLGHRKAETGKTNIKINVSWKTRPCIKLQMKIWKKGMTGGERKTKGQEREKEQGQKWNEIYMLWVTIFIWMFTWIASKCERE